MQLKNDLLTLKKSVEFNMILNKQLLNSNLSSLCISFEAKSKVKT